MKIGSKFNFGFVPSFAFRINNCLVILFYVWNLVGWAYGYLIWYPKYVVPKAIKKAISKVL